MLYEIGPSLPFLVPAAVAVVVLLLLPMVKPGHYEKPTIRLTRRRLTALPGFASGLLLAASNWLYIGVIDAIWALYMTDLGARPVLVGVGFLLIALPSIVLTPISDRLADRMNPIKLALVAALVGVPLLAGFGLASGVPALLVVGALHSACWAFVSLPGSGCGRPGRACRAGGRIAGLGRSVRIRAGVGRRLRRRALYEAAVPKALFLITAVAIALTPLVVWLRRARWREAF